MVLVLVLGVAQVQQALEVLVLVDLEPAHVYLSLPELNIRL